MTIICSDAIPESIYNVNISQAVDIQLFPATEREAPSEKPRTHRLAGNEIVGPRRLMEPVQIEERHEMRSQKSQVRSGGRLVSIRRNKNCILRTNLRGRHEIEQRWPFPPSATRGAIGTFASVHREQILPVFERQDKKRRRSRAKEDSNISGVQEEFKRWRKNV